MRIETCWTLIERAAEGETAGREEFARRYLPLVRGHLESRWRGSSLESEVDDAAQEVFVACFRERGALSRSHAVTGGFGAFLYGVIRNVALQFERSKVRRLDRVEVGVTDDPVSEASGLSRAFDRGYARAVVGEALETMRRRAEIQGEAARKRFELLAERTVGGKAIRELAQEWREDARSLHLEEAKARREFRSALRQVVGLAERCAPERVDVECERLIDLLDRAE